MMKLTRYFFFILCLLGFIFIGFHIILNTNYEKKKIFTYNTINLRNTHWEIGNNNSLQDSTWLWMDSVYGSVIVRSNAYYDDRKLVTFQPCLRLYFLFEEDLNTNFWNSLRYLFNLIYSLKILEPIRNCIIVRNTRRG